MTVINGVIGGIGAAIIITGAIFSLAAKNKESEKVDAEQIHAIDNGLDADPEWVDEIRDGAFKGLVCPSVAHAASTACGFSEGDLAAIEKSYKFWGGREDGRLGSGCSDWLLGGCLASGIAAGAAAGVLKGSVFGLWVATFIDICVNDFRFRRIDLYSIASLALFGLLMGCGADIPQKLAQGLGLSTVLYIAAFVAEKACGKEVFGLGDVLLLGAVGASVAGSTASLSAACLVLLVECSITLAVLKIRKSDTALPFAPLAFLPALAFVLVA